MSSSQSRKSQPQQQIDDPWDPESAEALTRIYEESEAEWRESRSARRRPRRSEKRQQQAAQPAQPQSLSDNGWLEERLAEMASRLQQSIAGLEPAKSADTLGQRIDELEQRISAAFQNAAARLDGRNLENVEQQIGSLTASLEKTRTQLERLDAIDDRLRDLAERMDTQQRTALDAHAVETLVETAADRAAAKVAHAIPSAASVESLEAMLRDQMAERSRAEEMTASVLHTIEDALERLMDRVDGMQAANEPADLTSLLAETPFGGAPSAPHDFPEPLLGSVARATDAAQPAARATSLDAADYGGTAGEPRQYEAEADPADLSDICGPPRSLSAYDGGTAADAAADDHDLYDTDLPAIVTESDDRKPQNSTGGRRLSGSLLAVSLLALVAGGYFATSILLGGAAPAMETGAVVATEVAKTLPVVAASLPQQETAALGQPVLPREFALPAEARNELPEAIGAVSLRKAAAEGDAVAQFEVASRFADGRGVPADPAQALSWYQRSAMRGFAPAQFRLAGLFERGTGTAADPARAKVWYLRAAEQGHAKAMHNLAVLNTRPEAGREDYAEAVKWFREAAERGVTDSQYNLGLLHLAGMGVTRSPADAYKWLALASRGGDREAAERLDQVRPMLSPAEITALEQQVSAWRARSADPVAARQPDKDAAGGAQIGG